MISVEKKKVMEIAEEILKIDSPSGFCFEIMKFIEKKAKEWEYGFELTNKGGAVISIPGKDSSKTVALSAHVDTLGAMVRSIENSGKLRFTLIGGVIPPTLDSEFCKVVTRDGKKYSGTFLSKSPAAHVHKDARTLERNVDNMEIVLDEMVKSKDDVKKLGIESGDYIFIDPKTTVTESGFLKSRFIDDKGSVACIMYVLDYLSKEKIMPKYNTKVILTNFEEVGHGASYIDPSISEVLAIDMGCIGEDLSCSEYDVSICAKDSSGPYDYNMVSDLINYSKEAGLDYAVDIYPMYSSDVSAALKGGNNIKGALIGPGVSASHGLERTHFKGFENTIKLMYMYLTK